MRCAIFKQGYAVLYFLNDAKKYRCSNFEHAFKYPAQFLRRIGVGLLIF
jgi:hypothetical protein